MSENKKEEFVTFKIPKFKIIPEGTLKEMTKNPWIASTFILGVLFLILIVVYFNGVFTNVSKDKIGEDVLSFYQSLGVSGVELNSVNEVSGIYQVNLAYQGQTIPIYITKDGKYIGSLDLFDSYKDSSGEQEVNDVASVTKSDKPEVELFVMSHCPYGTQIEKGILPVASLLKDKIDFEVKFVYYAMHGRTEVDEQVRQYCIQEEQNPLYLDYLKCFLSEGDSENCLSEIGIDMGKLNSCVLSSNTKFNIDKNFNDQSSWLSGRFPLFDVHKEDNNKYQIAGSPTLIINGVEATSGRDSVSLLKTICGAFNNPPEECSTQLDSTAPGPGFGWDAASSANLANCGF